MSRPLFRLRDIMPKGLYWRTLLIIVAPAALLQLIITLVFLDDHWQATSKRMSQGVAADVGNGTLADAGGAAVELVDESVDGMVGKEPGADGGVWRGG